MSEANDARPADPTVIDALAAGIATSIRQAALAEDRLTTFAFREDGPARAASPPPSPRSFVRRVLAAAGDPTTVRLLELAGDEGVPMTELLEHADLGADPGDRVALAERVAAAAACGLVGRELESDRVARTPLGSALLRLVRALEAGVAAAGAVEVRR